MKCTVIIPAYNAEKYIAKSITSAINEAEVHEVLVVDDGSTDQTAEIAGRFGDKVKLIKKNNSGQSAARNSALKYANGEVVVFLDADDELLPGAIRFHIEAFKENPKAVMVFGSNFRVNELGKVISENRQDYFISSSVEETAMKIGAVPSQCMYLLKKVIEVGGYNEKLRFCEDFDLNIRISNEGKIISHGNFVMNYRSHPGQATEQTSKLLISQIEILRKNFDIGKKFENKDFLKSSVRKWSHLHGKNIPAEIFKKIKKRKFSGMGSICKALYLGFPFVFMGFFTGIKLEVFKRIRKYRSVFKIS